MTPTKLKQIMDEHGLRPEDVASRAEIGVRTVTRFLARECAISHLAEKALDRMAAELRLPDAKARVT